MTLTTASASFRMLGMTVCNHGLSEVRRPVSANAGCRSLRLHHTALVWVTGARQAGHVVEAGCFVHFAALQAALQAMAAASCRRSETLGFGARGAPSAAPAVPITASRTSSSSSSAAARGSKRATAAAAESGGNASSAPAARPAHGTLAQHARIARRSDLCVRDHVQAAGRCGPATQWCGSNTLGQSSCCNVKGGGLSIATPDSIVNRIRQGI